MKKKVTVAELIAKLQKQDPKEEVFSYDEGIYFRDAKRFCDEDTVIVLRRNVQEN